MRYLAELSAKNVTGWGGQMDSIKMLISSSWQIRFFLLTSPDIDQQLSPF